ncbi:MAG: hypothetical protein WBV65_13455, partial [Xanthobacteraceae bacterium]
MINAALIRGGKASAIFSFPLRVKKPPAISPPGVLLSSPFSGRRLFAAHHVAVFGRLFEEAAVDHPVDLLLEFVGLIGFDADELRHQALRPLFRVEVAQHLVARATFVFAQPLDGAVECAAQLGRGLVVDFGAGNDAAAPA